VVLGSGAGSGVKLQWLVSDHLGTPRIILDQSGSLTNATRHDYLPFGEELNIGLRAPSFGYSGDGVRQQFTSKELDIETGLHYFGARYCASIQGRFTGSDPGAFTPADPQNFNRYSFVQNNPLKFIDPTGRELSFIGSEADYIVSELQRFTGLKLIRDVRTGNVSIDRTIKRNMNGTSTWFANLLIRAIGDSRADVKIETGRSQAQVFFDSYKRSQLDVDDYDAFKKADSKFAAAALAHVIDEYYYEQIIPVTDIDSLSEVPAGGSRGPLNRDGRFFESHLDASDLQSKVLSDFTGWWEKPYQDKPTIPTYDGGQIVTFEFSSVSYDVIVKNSSVVSISKYEKQKPRK
jgi:RHS repeat-associated protein